MGRASKERRARFLLIISHVLDERKGDLFPLFPLLFPLYISPFICFFRRSWDLGDRRALLGLLGRSRTE